MKRYRVKVCGVTYEGIFAHSCDAVLDALERYPLARGASARLIAP